MLHENYDYGKWHKSFEGCKNEAMRTLIAEGYTPLSISDIVEKMLVTEKTLRGDKRDTWWNTSWGFETFDAFVEHPDRKVKIVVNAPFFKDYSQPWKLFPEGKDPWGALILPDGMYETLEGPEFTFEDISKYRQPGYLSHFPPYVLNNPIWNVLVKRESLKQFVDAVFNEQRERMNRSNSGEPRCKMDIYLGREPGQLKQVVAGNFELCGGYLNIGHLFDSGHNHFIGINLDEKYFDTTVKRAVEAGKPFDYKGRRYTPS